MGQSMNRPDSQKARQSNLGRLSVRSLQRSGRSSVNLQRQTNRSGSKISPYYPEENPKKIFTNNPFPFKNHSKYSKNDEQPIISLKNDNKMQNERASLKGEDSNYSPEFKQIVRDDCDYELSVSKQVRDVKVVQKSHSDSRHDITISFSKTKHHLSNPFHDETIISRQNLFKILENEEDSQIQQNCVNEINQNLTTELEKQMILAYKKQKQSELKTSEVANQSERRSLLKKNSNQNVIDRKKLIIQSKIRQNQKVNESIPFNDYDYDQNHDGYRLREGKFSKKIILTKNMQQVRNKIALVGEITDSKSQLLKSVSLHNLSQSFRRVRNWQMSPRKSVQKVLIGSPCKQLNTSKEDKDKYIQQIFSAHNVQSSQIFQVQRKLIINSPKTPRKRDNPSKLLLFNGNTTYLTETTRKQQIENKWNREENKLSHSNGTQASISEVVSKAMASKEEDLLKKSSEMKEKDGKITSLYVPAEGEEYDLIGLRSPKKIKLQKLKQHSSKPSIQYKMNKVIEKPKSSQTISSNEVGIFPLSPNKLSKTIGQYTHKPETCNNFQSNTIKNRKQLQEPKKRYRSSQQKVSLQSKLVLF